MLFTDHNSLSFDRGRENVDNVNNIIFQVLLWFTSNNCVCNVKQLNIDTVMNNEPIEINI